MRRAKALLYLSCTPKKPTCRRAHGPRGARPRSGGDFCSSRHVERSYSVCWTSDRPPENQRAANDPHATDDVENLSQIWAVAPALVKLALRDVQPSQKDKEPPWKRIAKGRRWAM